ncbi:MAG: CpaF family protein [Polyangia bacterium]
MSDFGTVRARVQERLLAEHPSVLSVPSRWERRVRVREAVARLLGEERLVVAPSEMSALVRDLADAIVGLGPLEPLLHDPTVTEVMVNGPKAVYVERAGRIERAPVVLEDDAAVVHLIDRIVGPLGLRADESSPWVDARLPDGSRVHAILPPLAVCGPTITIRRFSAVPMTVDDLVRGGSMGAQTARALVQAVRARRSIMVSGGAGAGKTTLLGALAAHIDAAERVITIEDAAELRLQREHVVALETRPANVEGRGRVTVRDLVRNALRMRPDRIIVGEVRGAEVIDMLQAMNSGHDGSMSTAHANSPTDLIARLEAMAMMGEDGLSVDAVRRQLAAGLDIVVHVARTKTGARVVTDVCTIADGLVLQELRP